MAALPDGIYRVETAMDASLIWDVANESLANKANLMIFGQNQGISYAGNHQRFLLSTSGGYRQLFALHSGKAIEVFGKTSRPANGDNVSQYAPNGGANQKWLLQDAVSSHGAACHYVASAMGASYVLDAEGAVKTPGANVMLREKWADESSAKERADNQKWVFVRDSYWEKGWPVPANVGMSLDRAGAASRSVAIPGGKGTVYPAWTCAGSRFQMRYRWRGRNKGADTWSGWAAWREPSGSTANGGWGDPWATDLEDHSPGLLKHFLPGISVDLGAAYDKMEFQVEAMRFEPSAWIGPVKANGPAHGGSAAATVSVVARPNVSVSQVAFAPDGLRIAYSSDFARGGNRVDALSVTCGGRALVSGFQARGLAASGTLVVPFEQLAFVPEDGAACTVGFNYWTVDTGVWVSAGKALSYDASHGLALAPSFEGADGYSVLAKLPGASEAACYLQTEQDGRTRFSRCEEASPGTFRVLPPFGKPYRLFLTARSGQSWGTKVVDRPAVSGARAHVWNWAGGGWFQLPFNAERDFSLARDFEAVQANGRARESVFFGDGSAGSVTVEGTLVPGAGVDHGGVEDFESLAACGHAVLRAPDGERLEVAVTATGQAVSNTRWRDVTVTMRERQ